MYFIQSIKEKMHPRTGTTQQ